jgi:GNAT superfamily N-acetyltransferase
VAGRNSRSPDCWPGLDCHVMRIRSVEPAEWEALRLLRLEALLESPDAFGGVYADEVAAPRKEWRRWISGQSGVRPSVAVTFVAEDDGFLGMATGVIFNAEPERAHLFGMWVRPETRGQGLGMELVEQVAAWAGDHGASELVLRVTEGNSPALRLYGRAGFVANGARSPLREGSDMQCVTLVRRLN